MRAHSILAVAVLALLYWCGSRKAAIFQGLGDLPESSFDTLAKSWK